MRLFLSRLAIAVAILLVLVPMLPLTEASNAEERAQCQCSVDGLSGGRDVFYNEKSISTTCSTYPSQNIDTGAAPYEFIGCGAHKFYYDDKANQVAGYPWRLCYTYGGKRGCTITKLSQKHSLNSAIAYRFCNGDYDCDAKAHRYVQKGTVASKLTLDEVDSDGHLQDWTNCCQECRLLHRSDVGDREPTNCVGWDFNVETMECRLFSKLDQVSSIDARSDRAPFWYSGTPGFDDAPVSCWHRNKYDTCRGNFKSLFIASVVLGSIGLIYFICFNWGIFTRRYGWTTDVTPQAPRYETRKSSGKSGSRTHQVTIYQAMVVYRINGTLKRRVVSSEGFEIRRDEKHFFKVEEKDRFVGIGQRFSNMHYSNLLTFLLFSMPSMICLMALAFQVFLTDGGRFQAVYDFPGVGKPSTVVWGIVACCLAIAMVLAVPFLWWLHRWSLTGSFRPENTYTKPDSSNSNSSSNSNNNRSTEDAESGKSKSYATTSSTSLEASSESTELSKIELIYGRTDA